jgi:hypothetical protein
MMGHAPFAILGYAALGAMLGAIGLVIAGFGALLGVW